MEISIFELLEPWLEQLQEIENVAYSFLNFFDIEKINKAQLDKIAQLVGLQGASPKEIAKRIEIFAKINENTSKGNFEDVANAFLNLVSSSYNPEENTTDLQIKTIERYPLELELQTTQNLSSQEQIDFVFESMSRVVASGVKINILAPLYGDGYFRFGNINGKTPGYDEAQAGFDNGKFGGFYEKS